MKGIIYLITSNNLKYVGSTKQRIQDRLYDHQCFKLYDMDKNNYSLNILEERNFNDKEELRKKEQYYIEHYKCCNKLKAYNNLTKSEIDKNHYQKNKEKIKRANKQHYETNKKQILEKQKKKYETNRKQILQKQKQYQIDNKEHIKRKGAIIYQYKCSWGGDKRTNNNLLEIDLDIYNEYTINT